MRPKNLEKSSIRNALAQNFASIVAVLTLLVLGSAFSLRAAELRPETLRSWNEYIQAENSLASERLQSGQFLWSDESPERNRRVRGGEILVAPVDESVPKSVPHGLIHDWVGAIFLPGAKLEDVFAVVRDHTRYKYFYAPTVIDSKSIREAGTNYEFSLLMLNRALFAKFALDSEFEESYVRLDERRWYSTSSSTSIREVEKYGQPDQHELAPNEGSGYIWRLYSLSRFEERDGGVYVELEAIALSRDIPAAMRWAVNPVVRRVSKGSLLLSLQKTEEAVRASAEAANRMENADKSDSKQAADSSAITMAPKQGGRARGTVTLLH